ncbi:MAG: hypothetical protein FGM30_05445 [Candidatus Fonsibacter sp.]|nr:hypothetical protein [Candidatus Fonsibacter sp.]
MSINKMEETFTHIRNYWKEEEYKKCELEWKQIQPFISKEQTPYHCNGCNTFWISVQFINDHENICPKCDTHCQPILCNSVNWLSVLKYIDPKYHHYLIPKHHIIDIAYFLDYIKDDLTDNIILIDDNFTDFLNGLTLKTLNIEYIGFYEQKTNNVYFYVKNPDKYKCNILYNSWLMFMDIYDDCKIKINIYAVSGGLFYKEDEYEPDRKYLYKYLMNKIVDKWINNDE